MKMGLSLGEGQNLSPKRFEKRSERAEPARSRKENSAGRGHSAGSLEAEKSWTRQNETKGLEEMVGWRAGIWHKMQKARLDQDQNTGPGGPSKT